MRFEAFDHFPRESFPRRNPQPAVARRADCESTSSPDTRDDDPDSNDAESVEPDDAAWDAFLADDDERDPVPEAGDFWGSTERGAWSEEPD